MIDVYGARLKSTYKNQIIAKKVMAGGNIRVQKRRFPPVAVEAFIWGAG